MKFYRYVNNLEPFLMIYESLPKNKKYEFETLLENIQKEFNRENDNKLFHPHIAIIDGYIIIEQEEYNIYYECNINDELKQQVLIPRTLLDEILNQLCITHGLKTIDETKEEITINNNELCDAIERILI